MENRKIKYTALLVALTFFMENLDATIIVTALPAMAATFRVATVDLNIGISAYLLAVAVFIPIGGWLADRFGARVIFISAIVLFTVASILCALSNDLTYFTVARIVQGIGGALMVPVGRLVVIRATPKKELVQAIAYITWPGLIAPIIAPAVGGFMVTHFAWQWIFYINVPLGLFAIYAGLKLIENTKDTEIGRFDWIGFLMLATACAMVMYGIERVGQDIADAATYLTICALGVVLFILAARYMARIPQPLLKFDAFQHKTFASSIIGGSIFRISISAVPFLLPLMFQVAFGLSALHAGLLILTVFVGNIVMKPFTARIMRRFGFRKILMVNGVIGAITIASGALFTPETPWIWMVILLFVSGLSRSLQFTCYSSLSFVDILPKDKRYATTQFSLFFQISLGMGVALAALILRGLMHVQGHDQPELVDFHWTYLIIAAFSLLSLFDTLKLKKDAGDVVSGYQQNASH